MKSLTRLLLEISAILLAAGILVVFSLKGNNLEETTSQQTLSPPAMLTVDKAVFYDSKAVWPSVMLYPVSGTAKIHLKNLKGETIHTWNIDADRARLLPNCNLLVIHGSKWGLDKKPWEALRPVLREYDWEGKVVWEYRAPDIIHHDVRRLSNGNTLFLYRNMLPDEVKARFPDPLWRRSPVRSDSILEVSPQGIAVWSWHAHEHLDLSSCGRRGCNRYVFKEPSEKRRKDWTHINTAAPLPENKWYDGGDARFRPGNILIMPRRWWEGLLIDKTTGDVIWRYGGDVDGGIVRGHEIHMIEKGLPGAGNILIFDNGHEIVRPYSIILEINPVTKKVVWIYKDPERFFSRAAGSVQRLPNGNTFISEDVPGRVFEVNPSGKVVWEYKNSHRLSRAHRYPLNYCPKIAKLLGQN